jgi:DNA-directed RNA polymerase subunit RPC12/RpoP
MKDRISKASEELQEKSPFVCTSCGHPHDIVKVRQQLQGNANVDFHDRFSDAVKEEGEKSAFKCESCGHHQIVNKE